MVNQASQCPKCKKYILGEYCFQCKINVHDDKFKDWTDAMPDVFKDIFNKFKDK